MTNYEKEIWNNEKQGERTRGITNKMITKKTYTVLRANYSRRFSRANYSRRLDAPIIPANPLRMIRIIRIIRIIRNTYPKMTIIKPISIGWTPPRAHHMHKRY